LRISLNSYSNNKIIKILKVIYQPRSRMYKTYRICWT